MLHLLLIYLFLASYLFLPTQCLEVLIYDSTTVTLSHHYTTLGTPPKQQTINSLSVIFLSSYNFSKCNLSPTTTPIEGSLVVLESFPAWQECVFEEPGIVPTIGREIQKAGAIGIIITAREKFAHGIVLAFDPSIHIPFVVVQADSMRYLVKNKGLVQGIQIGEIDASDAWFSHFMTGQFLEAQILIGTLFFVDLCLMSFTLYDDLITRPKANRLNWHTISLKITAIISSVVGILFLSVDPFSFKAYSFWNSSFVINLYTVLYLFVLMMLLQLWIVATGNTMSKIVANKYFAHIMHAIAALVFVVGVLDGALPGNTALDLIYEIVEFGVIIICGIGFICFGGNIVRILRHSGNVSQDSDPLMRKIIIFIIVYVVFIIISAVLGTVQPMGYVMSVMFALFTTGSLIVAAVAILFLPPIIKRKCKERKLAKAIVLVPLAISSGNSSPHPSAMVLSV